MAALVIILTTTTGRERNTGGIEHIKQNILQLRYVFQFELIVHVCVCARAFVRLVAARALSVQVCWVMWLWDER